MGSVIGALKSTITTASTNELAKKDEKDEEKDPRRLNSLAFFVSQFITYEGEEFGKVIDNIKKEKFGGKQPKIRNSSE